MKIAPEKSGPRRRVRKWREGSFTLIEVTIALALMAFLIVEVASVQGNSIVFADYGRSVTQATWLARRVLSQVQYYYNSKPFTELETKTEGRFEDYPEYNWSLEIKEWEFPLTQLLTSGIGGGEEEEEGEAAQGEDPAFAKMIETAMEQVFGDEPKFMTAFVEVSWAEGARKNSTSMTYLLTNQAKLDEAIVQLKPVYDKLTRGPEKNCATLKKASDCRKSSQCIWAQDTKTKAFKCRNRRTGSPANPEDKDSGGTGS